MDVLIQDNIAIELFPDGAPELHPSLIVINDYDGDVQIGYHWNGQEFISPKSLMTLDDKKASLTRFANNRLDAFAQSKGYDSILSACTYATSTDSVFATEGKRCVELRDITWIAIAAIIADAESGSITLPDDIADIEANLPELTW